MNHLALRIKELQRIKIEKIKGLSIPKIEDLCYRCPIFSIKQLGPQKVVCINSSSWELAMLAMKDKVDKFEDLYRKFKEIDNKQLDLFLEFKDVLVKEFTMVTKVLGIDLASVLLCEIGSIERLAKIPSNNLKGVGYVKNCFYSQQPYILFHSVLESIEAKEKHREVRLICRKVSKAAKIDCFAGSLDEKDKERMLQPVNNLNHKKEPPKKSFSGRGRKLRKRGGRLQRKRRKLYAERKEMALKKLKSKDETFELHSSIEESSVTTD